MNVIETLNGPAGDVLGWTLIHLLWQATAIAVILGAIRAIWTTASSNARYLTAILALLAVLALPPLTFAHLWSDQVPGFVASHSVSPAAETAAMPGAFSRPTESAGVATTERLVSKSLPWIVGFWMVGVLFLAIRLIVRTVGTSRLTRERVIEVEGSWHRVIARLQKKLAIRQKIAIFESTLVEVPTVVGWIRPVILVPTSVFTGLTYRQIETILAHELAHIRRFDALVNFVQSIIETLFFYHPAVWWISGRIRIEREYCCDDIAIDVCRDRVAYARALTFLEESRTEVPAGAVAATGGPLLERIRRIAGAEERDRKTSSIAALVIVLMLGGATAWAVSAPAGETTEPDIEVTVGENGWWLETPPVPPVPPTPPAPPAPPAPSSFRTFSVPAPAAPPVPPAPSAPSLARVDMLSSVLAEIEELGEFEIVIPEAPEAPEPFTVGIGAAPSPPVPPAAPRIARVAPRPDRTDSVRGKRIDGDRRISEELDADDLIRLRSAGVSSEYLDRLREAGYSDPTVGEAAALRSVGVTGEYIRAMKEALGADLTTRELLSLRSVGVTQDWIDSIEELSGKPLDVREAILMRGVGLDPEWIAKMRRVLGASLTVEDAVRLRGVGVSESYIEELGERGLAALPIGDLIRLRGVGVTPEYIEQMQRLSGLVDLSADNLVRLRGVGVSPEYISGLAEAGLPTLDLETIVRLRGVGVSPEYIEGLREAGLNVSSVSELVRLRGVGVTPEYVREVRESGLEDLTIEKLIRLRGAGVDADFIREIRE